jgi:hypothetical protein
MRKIKLNIDALKVDSFETRPAEDGRGTVRGNGRGAVTQYGSCQGSCVHTCGGPTCEAPCQVDPTMYVTCVESCGWTDGEFVCLYC